MGRRDLTTKMRLNTARSRFEQRCQSLAQLAKVKHGAPFKARHALADN